jgi:type IV fimbrial biogenesis protein FimT
MMHTAVRPRGFTLIELLVTVVLAGVVIALVGPSMRDLLTRQRLRSVNSELQTDLQFARGEAVRRSYPVHIRFGSNVDMSCYVIFMPNVAGSCDCLLGPTQACFGGHTEIKTVQVPRAVQVALAASSAASTIVVFDWRTGQSQPGDFRIDATGGSSGALRTTVNASGRPTVCSPDGSVPQVPRCPG